MNVNRPRVYIAGPMRGIKDFNFPTFDTAAKMLAERGYAPINPADHDREGGFEGIGMSGHEDLSERKDFDLRETLKWDLEQVAHADYVAVLPGWERSSGARAEVALANTLGVKVYGVFDLTSDLGPQATDLVFLSDLFAVEAPKPPQTGEVRTTSATGGEKGTKPERYDLIPVEALAQVARLYGRGAEKYAAHNWRKGYEWSKSYAAMQRHATQFWGGEDIDPEMQLPHLASVVFHAFTLLVFMEEQRGFDDRYSTTSKQATVEPAKAEEPKDTLYDPLVETYWKDLIDRAKLPDYGNGTLIPDPYQWVGPSWNPGQIICGNID